MTKNPNVLRLELKARNKKRYWEKGGLGFEGQNEPQHLKKFEFFFHLYPFAKYAHHYTGEKIKKYLNRGVIFGN